MTRNYSLFLLIVALLLFPAQGVLAASVSITSSGNGAFIIQGDGMDTVSGINLTVNYDPSLLASPSVSQGSLLSGAMMGANTGNPGIIKIAVIKSSPFPASGQIALISFATHTGTGRVAVSSSMINSKGAPVPGGGNSAALDFQSPTTGTPDFITTAGVPFSQPGATVSTATGSTAASSTPAAPASSTPTYLGTVSMPADVQPKSDTKPADTAADPVQVYEPAVAKPIDPPAEVKPAEEPQKPEKVTMTSYKGVLDNFRAYKGEKSPAIFIALFNKEITPTIRQEPAVVLSDGKTPLKIIVTLEKAVDKSPNFAFNGAKMVSLNKDASSAWIIEVLPQAGIVQASLTILTDSEIIEYPLTLSPPVEGVSSAEADFAVFLKDSGAATPKRDLNGDGRHDYLDDFIYTAHYLMRKGTTGKTKK